MTIDRALLVAFAEEMSAVATPDSFLTSQAVDRAADAAGLTYDEVLSALAELQGRGMLRARGFGTIQLTMPNGV